MIDPIPRSASTEQKRRTYAVLDTMLRAMLEDEPDWIAAMATVACELHHAFGYYDWTGFYRAVSPTLLVVGPYQGTHGCLRIPFDRGVCGAAATTRATQRVPDVHAFPGHIACSSSTQSETVVPLVTPDDRVLAVLDVDSNDPDAFDAVDQAGLERICAWLSDTYASNAPTIRAE